MRNGIRFLRGLLFAAIPESQMPEASHEFAAVVWGGILGLRIRKSEHAGGSIVECFMIYTSAGQPGETVAGWAPGCSGFWGDDQVAVTIPWGVSGCNVPGGVSVSRASGFNTAVSNYTTVAVPSGTRCSSPGRPPSRATLLSPPLITAPVTADAGTGGFTRLSSIAYVTQLDGGPMPVSILQALPVSGAPYGGLGLSSGDAGTSTLPSGPEHFPSRSPKQ